VKKCILVFLGIIGCSSAIQAQGEIDLQQRVFYRNEWSLAVMLNSNGFGANYRAGIHIDAANKRLYEIDFAYFRDPKEQKSNVNIMYSTARYVEGKKNLPFNFRAGYGRQHERFRKHDVGGVAIRYFYNFGPSLMLLKPIYYDIGESVQIPGTNFARVEHIGSERYDPQWRANNIHVISRASFFKGFNGLRVVPGVYAKYGYNFEFGSQDRVIHALEAGLIGEAFLRRIDIMDFSKPNADQRKDAQNRQVFLTIFLSYRFGRIVDPYEVRRRRERSREISY
jgi:hypothetical protein